MGYSVSNDYKLNRYSGDNDHKIYIEYDGVEIENAPLLTEKVKWTRKIIDNGSKTLKLDNFVSQTTELIIKSFDVTDTTKEFYIKIGTKVNNEYEYVPLGYFHIKDSPSTASRKTTYKLVDRSTKFDVHIDLSDFIIENGGKITKRQAVEEYCRKVGVEFATPNFIGANDEISVYDNTITARIHISYFAENAGCFATIGRDGKLYFIPLVKPNSNNTHIIPERVLNNKMNNSKGTFKISKVLYEGALMPFQKGNEDNDTLFINTSNLYISKQEDIDRIYENVVGLEIDNINTSWIIGDPSIDPWDYIQYSHTDDEGNVIQTFTSLAQYTLEFNGVFKQKFETEIDREAKKINSSVNNTLAKYRKLRQEIDNVEAELKVYSEEQDEISSKVGNLLIRFDEISTRVETVVDVDEEKETGKANLNFTNINNGTPIFIHIHPIDEEIGDNYPTPYKTPRPKLTPKSHSILRFHNITENEDTDYIIPTQLRVFNNVYDELYINYVKKKAYVTRRIGVNEDGWLYLLENELIEDIPLPSISLKNGDYKVSLLGYDNAYLRVSLMIQNIYTTQFPTKDFMGSLIKQLRDSILLEVREGYIDKDDILAQINLAIEEGKGIIKFLADTLLIDTDNFKLDEIGKLECIGAILKDVIINGGYINFTKNNDKYGYKTFISYQNLTLSDDLGRKIQLYLNDPDEAMTGTAAGPFVTIQSNKGMLSLTPEFITLFDSNYNTLCSLDDDSITANQFLTNSNGYIPSSPNITKFTMMYSNKWYLEVITNAGAFGLDVWESDKRLKKDIADTKLNALDIIDKIKHREFKYKVGDSELIKIGYVADELQEIDEQMIFEVGEDKIKQPSSSYIIPLLSKGIQELQEIVENQNKEIDDLKQRISQLEKLIKGE